MASIRWTSTPTGARAGTARRWKARFSSAGTGPGRVGIRTRKAARTLENASRKPSWTEQPTETSRLLRAYREHGDINARERLIELYLPLVEPFARRYQRSDDYDDLFQAGSIGLINAIDRFDLAHGGELTAFAVPNIVGEIKRHLRDRTGPVRVPRPLQELRSRVMRCEAELGSALGRRPTPAELARELQVGEDDVAQALRVRQSGEEPDEATPAGLDDSDERMVLASAFEALDERERQIVYLRFVQDLSRKHVAQKLGISERHLSRQTQVALAKLREQLEGGGGGAAPPTSELVGPPGDTAERSASRPGTSGRTQQPSSVRPEASSKRTGQPSTAPTAPARAAALQRFLGLPYHISVVAEGSRWTAKVDELPGCVGRGDNPEEAVRSVRGAMEAWIAHALSKQRAIPEPRPESGHSGRLLLRMPHSLHCQLAGAAESREVSLNSFIVSSLTRAVGVPSGEEAGDAARRPRGEEATVGDVDGKLLGSGSSESRRVRLAIVANLFVVGFAGIAAVILLILGWPA
jgi:RNA polymerase sigma-B factor